MQTVLKTIRVTRLTIDRREKGSREGQECERSITHVNFDELQPAGELSAAREAAAAAADAAEIADTSAGIADRQRAVVPYGGGRMRLGRRRALGWK